MDLRTQHSGLYPYYINKCFFKGEILESQEEVKIESKFQFDAILEEVKQYNSESHNQNEKRYIKLQ